MFSQSFSRRFLAACAAVGLLGFGGSVVRADQMASLSGYVYLDANLSDSLDKVDYAIKGAKVTLLRDSESSFQMVAYSDANGQYLFDAIDTTGYTGTYSIKLAQYSGTDGIDTVGQVYNASGVLTSSSTWGVAHNGDDALQNTITGITLLAGYSGVSYNFAKQTFPVELVSKRMLIAQGLPKVVPEPGTWALLLVGGTFLGTIGIARRRRR